MALITKNGDVAQDAQEAPKIEFPCANYLIKVVAIDKEDFHAEIFSCMRQHAPELDENAVVANRSSKGRFVSFNFRIEAQSAEHLANLHKDLMAIEIVKMVL